MKPIILAASLFLAITMPAFADDATDHTEHHPETAAIPAPVQPAAATAQDQTTKPDGMMACPMMKDGNNAGMSNGMTMQGGMMSGGTMDKSQMAQCPMMNAPNGTTPSPAATDGDAHNEHH